MNLNFILFYFFSFALDENTNCYNLTLLKQNLKTKIHYHLPFSWNFIMYVFFEVLKILQHYIRILIDTNVSIVLKLLKYVEINVTHL